MKVILSASAEESVAASMAATGKRERTDAERAYDAITQSVVFKDAHVLLEDRRVSEIAGDKLYTVTTIASSARYGGTRTPVVCKTFERAKEIVEENEGDIFEYSYMLVVIEAVMADTLYGGSTDEQYWYVWKGDGETGGYVPIERPKAYKNTVGFGIG
jgi:hypothetical protein